MIKKTAMQFSWALGCGMLFVLGCGETPVSDAPPMTAESAPATTELDAAVFSAPVSRAATQECCTEVGRMDECWWEDALSDGVVCQVNADCPGGNCYREPANAIEGLCGCNTDADCGGGKGVCIEREVNGVNRMICGPSYCNGYHQCSCFGGCEWWHIDLNFTPEMEAAADGLNCCEGNYPEGGSNLIPYYSNAPCGTGGGGPGDPGTPAECTTDVQCDNGLECTVDTCVSGQCQHVARTGELCGAGVSTCGEYLCNWLGECQVHAYPAGDPCGDTHAADPCRLPDACDGAGVCVSTHYAATGTACGAAHLLNDCQNPDACDGSGTCVTTNYVVAGELCGDANLDNDCLNHDICNGTGFCVNAPAPFNAPCALDPAMYGPTCWEGRCGLLPGGPSVGVCEPVLLPQPWNVCAGAVPLGHFAPAQVGVQGPSEGDLSCVANMYSGGGEHCREWSTTNRLGQNTRDMVYRFTYATPDTTDPSVNHQLYAFLVRLESDVMSTLYTYSPMDNMCPPAGTVNSNRCLANHVQPLWVWEHLANTAGNHLSSVRQECSSVPGVGYWWCDRPIGAPIWTYPDAIVPCEAGTCDQHTTWPAMNISQAVVYPRGPETGGTHTVYIFVDGAGMADGSHDNGRFSLTVEKIPLNNGPCERVTDDPRVYDITRVEDSGVSVYTGSLEAIANSDHAREADQLCGTFDCAGAWGGTTPHHDGTAAGPIWPNAAHFKIHRPSGSGSQAYCIRTEDAAVGATDLVVEVRAKTDSLNICGSPSTRVASGAGDTGVSLTALPGVLYEVRLSERDGRVVPCPANDCNYRLVVEDEHCAFTGGGGPGGITPDLDCVAEPIIPNACTVLGITGSPPAGELFASGGNTTVMGRITTECSNMFNLISGVWPGIGGLESLVLLTNDTDVPKEVTLDAWDHKWCVPEYCSAGTNYWFAAAYTCDGALVDWMMRVNKPGSTIPPDTCNPGPSLGTDHTFVIPPHTTYQFITSTSPTDSQPICDGACPAGANCGANVLYDSNGDVVRGMNYGLNVQWADAPPIPANPCADNGYEFPVGSGICWYAGSPSLSCNSVCAGFDGCDAQALVDHTQNSANCVSLINGAYGLSIGSVNHGDIEGNGSGCVIRNFGSGAPEYWRDWQEPTCEATHTVIARVCPCIGAGAGGGGPVDPDPPCTYLDYRCGGTLYQQCDINGVWQTLSNCTYGCDISVLGGCYGECTPWTTRCLNSAQSQTCGTDYFWGVVTDCPYFCDQAATQQCAGQCNAGQSRCDGLRYQVCNASHYWVTSETCDFACDSALSPPCYGDCVAGDAECLGVDTSRECDGATNLWNPSVFCPADCDPSTGRCYIVCPPDGEFVGGYCWYLGAGGQDCNTVCGVAGRGGYNEATRTYAGSDGTNDNCRSVLEALNSTYGEPVTTAANDRGCVRRTDTNANQRGTTETTATGAVGTNLRACACNTGSIECTTGDTRCNGTTFETCVAPGFWVESVTCTYGCNGTTGCYGVCHNGDRRCDGPTDIETCVDHNWVLSPCPYYCNGVTNACDGECVTNDRQCVGDNHQECNGSYVWQTIDTCIYGCDAAAGCFGVCTPGDIQCASGTQYRQCNASFVWNPPQNCPYLFCDQGGSNACDGECIAGVDTYCDGTNAYHICVGGFWAHDADCPFVCDSIAGCLGECNPGATRCNGTDYQQICQSNFFFGPDVACPLGCDVGAGACVAQCDPGGIEVGGYCWHMSGGGNSCNAACAAHGGVHDATRYYAGTPGGTNDNCRTILEAHGLTAINGVANWGSNRGCEEQSTGPWWFNRGTADTTYGSSNVDYNRACACVTGSKECETGQVRCSGDNRQVCDIDSTWQTAENCTYGCNAGACYPDCTPGTYRCNGNNRELCNASGTWALHTACTWCDPGTATCMSCVPSEWQCSGSNLQECDMGTWQTVSNCTHGCDSGTYTCFDCTNGTYRCDGVNDRQVCVDGRWQFHETCGTGCNAGTNACNNCVPGTYQCSNSTTRQYCNASGSWEWHSTCTYCNPGTATCMNCEPSTYRCSTNTTRQQCDAAGNWQFHSNCTWCLSGSCVACEPNTYRCNGNTRERCDATGSWVFQEACTICDAGTATCGNCVHGTYQCSNATTRQYCNSGTWQYDSNCTWCDPGTATCMNCEPGTQRCNGNNVESCSAAGNWTHVANCPFNCDSSTYTCFDCWNDSYRCNGANRERCVTQRWQFFENCPMGCNTSTNVCNTCTPGTYRCNGNDRQRCDSNGTWQYDTWCTYCDPGTATCMNCEPSTYRCSTNTTRQQCDAAGNWQFHSNCTWCLSGSCVACQPDTYRCNGNDRERCNASGSWVFHETCTICDAGTGSCGNCVHGTYQCSNSTTRQYCNSGTWEYHSNCTWCDPGTATCMNCEPGTHRCNGNNVESCSAAGNWTHVANCPFNCDSSTYTCFDCNSGNYRCNGADRERCDSGRWQFFENCPVGCNTSTNECNTCTPGTYRCNGTNRERCDSNGTWQYDTWCTYCDPGTATCMNCEPGAQRCNGNELQLCSLAGNWQTTQTCGFGCDSGSFTCFDCNNDTYRCDGSKNRDRCVSGRWQFHETCTYICSSGNCTGSCEPGTYRCIDVAGGKKQRQECNTSAAWQNIGPQCDYGCTAASGCYGTCTTGTRECVSSNAYAECVDYNLGPSVTCPAGEGCDNGNCVALPQDCVSNGGTPVGGYCWYLSGRGNSCTAACTDHGGMNAATTTYAGSGGTNDNCRAVLEALGYPYVSGPTTITNALGCQVRYDAPIGEFRRGTTATTAISTNANRDRACACNRDVIEGPTCASAGGVEVGGHCWFMSGYGGNCANTCTAVGGTYSEATRTYAGSSGSNDNCVAVLTAHGISRPGGVANWDGDRGCEANSDNWWAQRSTHQATTATGSEGVWNRACACDVGPQCTPASSWQCKDAVTRAYCEADNTWGTETTCACSCSGGSCATGACTIGETQCSSGSHVQTCQGDCTWGAPTACPSGTCSGTECTASAGACSSSQNFTHSVEYTINVGTCAVYTRPNPWTGSLNVGNWGGNNFVADIYNSSDVLLRSNVNIPNGNWTAVSFTWPADHIVKVHVKSASSGTTVRFKLEAW